MPKEVALQSRTLEDWLEHPVWASAGADGRDCSDGNAEAYASVLETVLSTPTWPEHRAIAAGPQAENREARSFVSSAAIRYASRGKPQWRPVPKRPWRQPRSAPAEPKPQRSRGRGRLDRPKTRSERQFAARQEHARRLGDFESRAEALRREEALAIDLASTSRATESEQLCVAGSSGSLLRRAQSAQGGQSVLVRASPEWSTTRVFSPRSGTKSLVPLTLLFHGGKSHRSSTLRRRGVRRLRPLSSPSGSILERKLAELHRIASARDARSSAPSTTVVGSTPITSRDSDALLPTDERRKLKRKSMAMDCVDAAVAEALRLILDAAPTLPDPHLLEMFEALPSPCSRLTILRVLSGERGTDAARARRAAVSFSASLLRPREWVAAFLSQDEHRADGMEDAKSFELFWARWWPGEQGDEVDKMKSVESAIVCEMLLARVGGRFPAVGVAELREAVCDLLPTPTA